MKAALKQANNEEQADLPQSAVEVEGAGSKAQSEFLYSRGIKKFTHTERNIYNQKCISIQTLPAAFVRYQ